jgi:hypothetical protein
MTAVVVAGRLLLPQNPRGLSDAAKVVTCARRCLEEHTHFRGRVAQFEITYRLDDETLVVRGFVPSFYLKQMLQTALRQIDGVYAVDNQVEVVSLDGLSST